MNYALKEDNQTLVLTHLSQLLDYVTGFGGLIAPLVIWLTQKDKIYGMDHHGKMILNFQLSILVYTIASIPLMVITLGLGVILPIAIAILGFIMPIVNAIKVNRGQEPSYPLSIQFIK
ncbi:hypothetical protein SAMN05216480_106105 [Pustulibacterium marinum]|uniref:tRNA modification GTPase n=1 Tax=Pustulibacterium marinum TaxID=1224947 RepID=A0A1I7GZ85_9FLAO|nr:DUF4870 domain-containing protein [Pustulibacterium marinum]SFU53566.1 hypothetical protein SAMN05216480_106105 [Pustulibacterium marinum]